MSLPGPPPLNDSSGNHALIVAIETYRTKRDHSLDGPATMPSAGSAGSARTAGSRPGTSWS